MHHAQDTYPLSDFKTNAKSHLQRLRKTGRPEILTVNGKAEAVVMSPEAYDRLIDAVLGAASPDGGDFKAGELDALIARAESDIQSGRVVSAHEAFARLRARGAEHRRAAPRAGR